MQLRAPPRGYGGVAYPVATFVRAGLYTPARPSASAGGRDGSRAEPATARTGLVGAASTGTCTHAHANGGSFSCAIERTSSPPLASRGMAHMERPGGAPYSMIPGDPFDSLSVKGTVLPRLPARCGRTLDPETTRTSRSGHSETSSVHTGGPFQSSTSSWSACTVGFSPPSSLTARPKASDHVPAPDRTGVGWKPSATRYRC